MSTQVCPPTCWHDFTMNFETCSMETGAKPCLLSKSVTGGKGKHCIGAPSCGALKFNSIQLSTDTHRVDRKKENE